MTVRLFTGPAPGEGRVGSLSAELGPRTTGTEYLRRRMGETQLPGATILRQAVARWVRAERSERHARGQLAGSLYHLVPRRAVPAYRRALVSAATEAGLTTVVSGPWPPYAFTD